MKLTKTYPEVPDRSLLASLHATAETNHQTITKQVERYRQELEELTGSSITVQHDDLGLEADELSRLAPGPGKQTGDYVITLRSAEAVLKPYQLARLLVRLEFEHKDSVAGEPVEFTPNLSQIQRTLPHKAASPTPSQKLSRNFGDSLIGLVQEMFHESHLSAKLPALAPVQKHQGLLLGEQRAMTVSQYCPESAGVSSPLNLAYVALLATCTQQWDQLLGTRMADYYRRLPVWNLSRNIHRKIQAHISDSKPGAIGRAIHDASALLGSSKMVSQTKPAIQTPKATTFTEEIE